MFVVLAVDVSMTPQGTNPELSTMVLVPWRIEPVGETAKLFTTPFATAVNTLAFVKYKLVPSVMVLVDKLVNAEDSILPFELMTTEPPCFNTPLEGIVNVTTPPTERSTISLEPANNFE